MQDTDTDTEEMLETLARLEQQRERGEERKIEGMIHASLRTPRDSNSWPPEHFLLLRLDSEDERRGCSYLLPVSADP